VIVTWTEEPQSMNSMQVRQVASSREGRTQKKQKTNSCNHRWYSPGTECWSEGVAWPHRSAPPREWGGWGEKSQCPAPPTDGPQPCCGNYADCFRFREQWGRCQGGGGGMIQSAVRSSPSALRWTDFANHSCRVMGSSNFMKQRLLLPEQSLNWSKHLGRGEEKGMKENQAL